MAADERWETVERPGYFGRHRAERYAEYEQRFGAGGWRLVWEVAGLYFTREQMQMLYEDAYYEFLRDNWKVTDQLVREAADVYDDALSNIASGFDYGVQETERTHVQDIAIRRALSRLGLSFTGTDLIRIRDSDGEHPLSVTLSPGQVPFHRPEWLLVPELEGWWAPGSVESFYQSNKLLQRRV